MSNNILESQVKFLRAKGYVSDDSDNKEIAKALTKASADGVLTAKALADFEEKQGEPSGPTARQVFSGGPNVKAPSAAYKTTKSVGLHVKTGRPVKDCDGRYAETASELELAKIGAFMKHRALKDGIPGVVMKEHETALLNEIFSADRFVGEIGGTYSKDWTGLQVKSNLYGDSTSGGIYAVPYWFDANLVTYPLIYGELFPLVDLVDMPRAMEVRGAQMNNPTVQWGPFEYSSSMSEFNTAGMVTEIDQNVYNLTFAVEMGKDFLQDSDVVNFGGYIVDQTGKVMLKELDHVIGSGDGATQPQGISNATGVANLTIGMPNTGPVNLGDIEHAYFGLPKQYRNAAHRVAWASPDSVYQQVRAMPIGEHDARRLFGEEEGSYTVMNYPWRINQNLDPTKAIFGAFDRYRMWRRQGQEVQFYREGKTLALANTILLVVRSRWAGQVIDASAFVSLNNLPTTY